MKNQKPNQNPQQRTISTRSAKVYPCSDARPFKSLYKGGYITPPNYLVELIFEKRANAFNSGKNAEQFWLTGNPLHGAYKGQVIQASKLLGKYHVDCISDALRSKDAKYIFKLQDKKLIPIIEKFEKTRKEKELIIEEQKKQEIAKPFSKNNNKLKGL